MDVQLVLVSQDREPIVTAVTAGRGRRMDRAGVCARPETVFSPSICQATSVRMTIPRNTLEALWTAIPIHALR
jgi:hypothetical protein